jgi:3-deoxy-manno-octulosonate cytidylyltransferase (CMP-KDO synthetase)
MTAPAGPPRRRPAVWAIIPARYESSRFPGKPLAVLAGKPMVRHVYERVRQAPSVSLAAVATDDERIRAAVEAFGGLAVMTGDHPTGTDRVDEAVRTLCARMEPPDYVLNVQGDEPLIDPNDLERLIQGLAARPQAVLGTLVHPLKSEAELNDPHVVKTVLDREGRALYFSRAPIPYPRAPGAPGLRHLGVYLFRRDFLHTFARLPPTPASEREQLEQLRALEHGHDIHCFPADTLGFGVDVPEQLQQMEALLASRRN